MNLQSVERITLVKLWDAMFRGARGYVEEQGFVGVHNMPELVGITGACENVDTLFKVDFFGKRGYLAQSDQLYLELLTPHLKRVYAEIQSFRMEPEADNRHLCQFSLFEIEHLGGLDELMSHIEGIVKYAAHKVLEDPNDLLAEAGVTLKHFHLLNQLVVGNRHFSQVTYRNAVASLAKAGHNVSFGDDLKADHEAALVSMAGGVPLFITHYPLPIKFFNMKQNTHDTEVVNSCDLLLPYSGESAGAAERETNFVKIQRRLKSSDMYKRLMELGGTDEDFAWYLDAHRDVDVPLHSGAGIGMARVAQFLLGVDDIRDAVPFVINSENLL